MSRRRRKRRRRNEEEEEEFNDTKRTQGRSRHFFHH